MTFGSLFSGIGGMDLGLERAGMRCVWQVEIDQYCQKVLQKHWPHVRRWDDVRTFPPKEGDWGCDLIAGGFPCQPVSVAGRRLGQDDARWLWPEVHRVLRHMRPRVALLENVPGLLIRGFDQVLRGLAECGFYVEWQSIPASAFGTHFRGERVYIVASRSPSSCLRRQGKWKNQTRAFAKNEFERLVERELQVCVSAGKDKRISDGVSHRVDRLRGLGNAVVPQVAEWIGSRIMETQARAD